MTRVEHVKCRAYRGTACATEVVLKAQGKLCSIDLPRHANAQNGLMPQDNARLKRGSPHRSTGEYVRELIGKDQREQRVRRLHTLVEEGLAGGPAVPDTPEDWAALHAIARGDLE
jgi:hypothetical protein